jgi:hypothetical protein
VTSACRNSCGVVVPGYQHMVVSTRDLKPGDFRLLTDDPTSTPRDPKYRQTFADVEYRENEAIISFQYPDGYWAERRPLGPREDHAVRTVSWNLYGNNTEHIWRPLENVTTITIEEDLLV